MTVADLLIEIHTEELPPKSLLKLAKSFEEQIVERLHKAQLPFSASQFYATPRRLAVLINDLAKTQPDQVIERRGPALAAAFDASGKPTPACEGFARSVGVLPSDLIKLKTPQGEWMGYKQAVAGASVQKLIPEIIEHALAQLPIAKRMRWGSGNTEFVRPVHAVTLLYGDTVIPATILNCQADRKTRGHRFHAPDWLSIPAATDYADVLKTGFVNADFNERKAHILQEIKRVLANSVKETAQPILIPALLDEVTNLVEWPVAICGKFDDSFLRLPQEVLISAMVDHQRYFPIQDEAGCLLPYFVTISNIQSKDPARVQHGNERVLRARLADAAFFYETDLAEPLANRIEQLAGIVYQAKLGSLHDKTVRVSQLAKEIASNLQADTKLAERAAMLAKCDLVTNMVGEFPQLQGTMGSYYAKNSGEDPAVAKAIADHYLPRFAGDSLPTDAISQSLALADRIDTLVGAFGVNQIPTGDKDPFGLRRAAVGIIRILIEQQLPCDLKPLLAFAVNQYGEIIQNAQTVQQVLNFILERLRAWYAEQGVSADVFAAVAALELSVPTDMHARMQAVAAFKKLPAAESLSTANKRVSNILAKLSENELSLTLDPTHFEHASEESLAAALHAKSATVKALTAQKDYQAVLMQLADLHQPVDEFFTHVMVMADDAKKRGNRLAMLKQLRALFLEVADIALLQS